MTEPNFESMRRAMVSNQLRTNAVTDPEIVSAMGEVAREQFVPADRAEIAYLDKPVPLAAGRALNVPLATARLLDALAVQKGEKVLVVGAATGYSAALLGHVGANVVAVEEDAVLAEAARKALSDVAGVKVETGPLAQGWAAGAPYDAVLIDGAVDHVPQAISDQLKDGGRIAAGLAERGVTRLASGLKAKGGVTLTAFVDSETIALPGFEAPKAFAF